MSVKGGAVWWGQTTDEVDSRRDRVVGAGRRGRRGLGRHLPCGPASASRRAVTGSGGRTGGSPTHRRGARPPRSARRALSRKCPPGDSAAGSDHGRRCHCPSRSRTSGCSLQRPTRHAVASSNADHSAAGDRAGHDSGHKPGHDSGDDSERDNAAVPYEQRTVEVGEGEDLESGRLEAEHAGAEGEAALGRRG
jgi:hypothetical protein